MLKACSSCGADKDLEDFHKRTKSKDGRQNNCKECNKDQRKEYYRTAHGRAIDISNGKRSKHKLRLKVLAYLNEHPCVDCGEDDPIVLEFDHKLQADKILAISEMLTRSWAWGKILTEIQKCEVRCANCHKRRTAIQCGWFKAWTNSSVAERHPYKMLCGGSSPLSSTVGEVGWH